MRRYTLIVKTAAVACLMLVAAMSAVAQTSVLYATDGSRCTPSTLYELNPADGSIVSTIGSTGVSGMNGLAAHPVTGVMYGITTGGAGCTANLYTVNLATGAASLIGPLGVPAGKPDATFSASGVLYTYSTSNQFIYTVNLATGAATAVGDTGVPTFDISLTFDEGTLVMTTGDRVYSVSTATGLATSGPLLGIVPADSNMSTTDPQTCQVYLGDRDGASQGELYTLNTSSGAMVLLGSNTIGQMSAIEMVGVPGPCGGEKTPVPTLSSYGLVLTMLGLLLVAARRLRATARK